MISSAAPRAMVLAVTASKQKRSASGATWLSVPISSQTVLTLENAPLRASCSTISTMPSHSAISCIGHLPYRETVADAGIEGTDHRLDRGTIGGAAKPSPSQAAGNRSEERRVGKSVDLGGRRIIKKK